MLVGTVCTLCVDLYYHIYYVQCVYMYACTYVITTVAINVQVCIYMYMYIHLKVVVVTMYVCTCIYLLFGINVYTYVRTFILCFSCRKPQAVVVHGGELNVHMYKDMS